MHPRRIPSLKIHALEQEIRARCQAQKRKVALEIMEGRWEKIDFEQVCRDLTAQMEAEIGAAVREGRLPNRSLML